MFSTFTGTDRLRPEDAHGGGGQQGHPRNVALRAPLSVLKAQASSGGPEPPHSSWIAKNLPPNVLLIKGPVRRILQYACSYSLECY